MSTMEHTHTFDDIHAQLPSISAPLRALIVESHPLWQNEYANLLEANQFAVSRVDDTKMAVRLLKACYYHVVIVNAMDSEVLHTIHDYEWLRHTVVVMCAPDGARLDDVDDTFIVVNNVVRYDRKRYYPDEFWKPIKQQLELKRLLVNIHVEIENPEVLELLSSRMTSNLIDHMTSQRAASALYPRDRWLLELNMKNEADYALLQTRLTYEIADLLRRSVPMRNLKRLSLGKIGEGLSKAAVALVTPYRDAYLDGHIIKMGYHKEIDTEFLAYEDYVLYYKSVNDHSPDARRGMTTPLLSSINYQFVSGSRSFVELYNNRFVPMEKIEGLLNHLFKDVYQNWFSDTADMQISAQHYMDYLNCHPDRFLSVVEYMQNQPSLQGYRLWGVDKLVLSDLPSELELDNPLEIFEDTEFLSTLKFPAPKAITHGDLNANNMLIKDDGKVHLIDFARTEKDHALRDFIQLETVVRFTLMRDATLRERFELEKVLAQQTQFDDVSELRRAYQAPEGEHGEELTRAFLTTCKIRELAWETVFGRQSNGAVQANFKQYQMGLFFMSLTTVRFVNHKRRMRYEDGLTITQALHALVAAALILKHLRG